MTLKSRLHAVACAAGECEGLRGRYERSQLFCSRRTAMGSLRWHAHRGHAGHAVWRASRDVRVSVLTQADCGRPDQTVKCGSADCSRGNRTDRDEAVVPWVQTEQGLSE